MEVIAYRKKGIWLMYAFTFFLGLCVPLIPVNDPFYMILTALFSLTFISVSLIVLIMYFTTPQEAIFYNEYEKAIYLKKGVKMQLSEIEDLSYRRASARGFQYKWGTIIIRAQHKKYKIRFIAQCEDVCKTLTKLKYENS